MESAQKLSLSADNDEYSVSLVRMGFYNGSYHGEYDVVMRVDFTITRKSEDVTEYLSIPFSGVKLADSEENLYNASQISDYHTGFAGTIFKDNDTRKGLLAFENVPSDVEVSKISMSDFIFDLENDKAGNFDEIPEQEYQSSKIVLNPPISYSQSSGEQGPYTFSFYSWGFYEPYDWNEPKILEREKYLRIDISLSNDEDGTRAGFENFDVYFIDDEGKHYENVWGGYYDGKLRDDIGLVAPGTTREGFYLFNVTDTSSLSEFRLEYDLTNNRGSFTFGFVIEDTERP